MRGAPASSGDKGLTHDVVCKADARRERSRHPQGGDAPEMNGAYGQA